MDYTRLRAMANQQLKDKGLTCTITKQTAGTYDPATGAATITTSTQSVYGVIFDYGNKNIDGVLIKEGDKQLLLSALTTAGATLTAPVVNDTVTVGGVVYTITMIKTTAPDGTAMMYECNVRA